MITIDDEVLDALESALGREIDARHEVARVLSGELATVVELDGGTYVVRWKRSGPEVLEV